LKDWDGTADVPLAEKDIADRSNYPFGQDVSVSFPGAIADASATFGTIPMPFDSKHEDIIHKMPSRPLGVMVSWDGPRYSGDGVIIDDGGQSSCMQYLQHDENPNSQYDCLNYEKMGEPYEEQFERGQMYTGPWDTSDGKVTIEWIPNGQNVEEVVSISMRLLGTIDEEDSSFVEEKIEVKRTEQAKSAWNQAIAGNTIPSDTECPEVGYRNSMPCDRDVDFVFNEALRKGDDDYITSMQGDPLSTLAEVTCHVDDASGMFVLDNDLIEDAMTYGRQHGAKGAIFYINRTTTTEMQLPAVLDSVGKRRDLSPMLVTSNAVQIGRFWFSDTVLDQ
jgi:hypothetical protein